jgi:hypothetical protein
VWLVDSPVVAASIVAVVRHVSQPTHHNSACVRAEKCEESALLAGETSPEKWFCGWGEIQKTDRQTALLAKENNRSSTVRLLHYPHAQRAAAAAAAERRSTRVRACAMSFLGRWARIFVLGPVGRWADAVKDVAPPTKEIVMVFKHERDVARGWRAWCDAEHGGKSSAALTWAPRHEGREDGDEGAMVLEGAFVVSLCHAPSPPQRTIPSFLCFFPL